MNDTIDALDTLAKSEGWRLLCDAARREWAERERIGVKNVVSGDEEDSINKLRQIVAAREAVEWVLRLPTEEIKRLKRQDAEPEATLSSRAGASVDLVGAMSRRGGL